MLVVQGLAHRRKFHGFCTGWVLRVLCVGSAASPHRPNTCMLDSLILAVGELFEE